MSESQADKFIHEQASVAGLAPGAWSQIAVARKSDDLLVGDAGLWLSEDSSEAEFGLTIAPDYQGQGWGTETVAELIRLLFRRREIQSIVATTDARNAPCIGALKSSGMRLSQSRDAVYKGTQCLEYVYRVERFDA